MKHLKKLLVVLLAATMAVGVSFGAVACKSGGGNKNSSNKTSSKEHEITDGWDDSWE